MKTLLRSSLIFAVLMLTACSTSCSTSVPSNPVNPETVDRMEPFIIVGVMQVIEQSDNISSEDVLNVVSKIRGTANLDNQITSNEIMSVVNSAVDLSRLTPTERYLVTVLITKIENVLNNSGFVNEQLSATVSTLLDDVELAANMAKSG